MSKVLIVVLWTRNAAIALAALIVAAGLLAEPPCLALDGETLRCGRERIRLHGVHAPGTHLPAGRQARQRLQQHVDSGEVLIFRVDRDMYGQTVGMVYVNGRRIQQSDVYAMASRRSLAARKNGPALQLRLALAMSVPARWEFFAAGN